MPRTKKPTFSARFLSIEFEVSGTIEQEVRLHEGVNLTAKQLQDGLRDGKYKTCLQNKDEIVSNAGKSIATIVYVEENLTMDSFSVDESE